MKRFMYLCLALLLSSCTSMESLKKETESRVEKALSSSGELQTQNIILNSSAPAGILNDISNSLKRGYTKEYNTTYNNVYEVYVGDYLSIPLAIGEDSYNISFYPLGVSYELKIDGNRLVFRGIYQGDYEVTIYSAGSYSRKITIKNRLKYSFTEQNNYEVIAQSYREGNLKVLSDSVAIHRIAFPNSFRDKELSFMLIDLAGKDGNAKIIKEEIEFLQKNTKLDEHDKLTIISSLKLLKDKNFVISNSLLEFNSSAQILNQEIASLIMEKEKPTQDEIVFLEKYYTTLPSKDSKMAEFLGKWYMENGDVMKGTQYLGEVTGGILPTTTVPIDTTLLQPAPTEIGAQDLEAQNYTQYLKFFQDGKSSFEKGNYVEALIYFEKASGIDREYAEQKDIYFYMGESHFRTENYSEAVKDFKNSLNLEKNDEKKAEIYYNIGITYDKLGDKEQAINYLTYTRQNYQNSPWSVKSSLYLLQQLQQNLSE